MSLRHWLTLCACSLALSQAACVTTLSDDDLLRDPKMTEARLERADELTRRIEYAHKLELKRDQVTLAGMSIATLRAEGRSPDTRAPGQGAPQFNMDNPPFIVVCQGARSNLARDGSWYADRTLVLGDMFSFDYPGLGDSDGPATIAALQSLTTELAPWLLRQTRGRPLRFWGHSFGGFACSDLAARTHAMGRDSTLILDSTVANATEASKYLAPDFVTVKVPDTLAAYDIPTLLADYDGPIFMVAGGKDKIIPPEASRHLYTRLKNDDHRVSLYEQSDANHYSAGIGLPFWLAVETELRSLTNGKAGVHYRDGTIVEAPLN